MCCKQFVSILIMVSTIAVAATGCFALPPQDCELTEAIITGQVVRRITPNTTNLAVVGIPNAQVEFISIQTQFNCPGAFGAERQIFTTDENGVFSGSMVAHAEDLFRVTISAEGCEASQQAPVNLSFFASAGVYRLSCNMPLVSESTATPSPTQ